MAKVPFPHLPAVQVDLTQRYRSPYRTRNAIFLVIGLLWTAIIYWRDGSFLSHKCGERLSATGLPIHNHSPYGRFPHDNDPFQFLPCTSNATLPALDDPHPRTAWAARFDPDPAHWSWGSNISNATEPHSHDDDSFAGRGIFLCGYLDVPLDYTNASDPRIVRLAITKFQVAGLARHDRRSSSGSGSDAAPPLRKSKRTLIVEPGGPGGSGVQMVWAGAQNVTQRLSESTHDVLGWDPRGVNASLPGMSCFPYDADRDRWKLAVSQARATVPHDPRARLRVSDAWNEAVFAACARLHGDLPRHMTTAVVARDLERIRLALGEAHVSGYFVSYGTGIGQTYANMYPHRVGRLILDGTEYVRDHRLLGGFGWTALDNATDAWRDGFLGECVAAGPEACALARAPGGHVVTSVAELEARVKGVLSALVTRPGIGYAERSGPSLVTYSALVSLLYGAMYDASSWPRLAAALSDLERGNTTGVAAMLDRTEWEYDPTARPHPRPATDELGYLVICGDSYDAPQPPCDEDGEDGDGLGWWDSLWNNMTAQNWIAGDSRFDDVFPCRHYTRYFGAPAEVYRGDLNATLAHPVLLIAETYDPATPLRNGRRLLAEMGRNARLVVHHGYGHSSRDRSACTDGIARRYILTGEIPGEQETACFADGKPYR